MPSEPSPVEPVERLLHMEQLEACLALDQQALGGLWNQEQWAAELADGRRPCLGLLQGEQLIALACGWLVVDELHITAVVASSSTYNGVP